MLPTTQRVRQPCILVDASAHTGWLIFRSRRTKSRAELDKILGCLRPLSSPPRPLECNSVRKSVFSRRNSCTHEPGMVGGTSSRKPFDCQTCFAPRRDFAAPTETSPRASWALATSSRQDPLLRAFDERSRGRNALVHKSHVNLGLGFLERLLQR